MRYHLRFVFIILIWLIATPVAAINLVRDADIEHALTELSRPILIAAGLSLAQIKILVLDSSAPNAFVVDHRHIFVSSGLILRSKRPSMLQSVIAHEAAHIANGHVTRRSQNMASARNAAAFGIALGIMTGALSGDYAAGGTVALGASNSAQRLFLSHTRAEESAADRAALSYMTRAGIDPRGMSEVLDIFVGQENLSAARQDPYTRTHPLSRDRSRAVTAFAQAQETRQADPKALYWHARATGKLAAFTRKPSQTLKAKQSVTSADIHHMRRAVALSRQGKLDEALLEISKAEKLRPKDAYYKDLKAELLMRHKRFGASAKAYAQAVQLAPQNALIRAGYGRALLANKQDAKALSILKKARSQDFRNLRMLRDLAVAYAKQGQNAMASLVTAERYALQGKIKDAKLHAKRASDRLPTGSPSWQRAQDVLDTLPK